MMMIENCKQQRLFLEKLGLLDFTDRGKKLKWMYCCCRRKVNEENLPISLELVIKSELCPSIYSFSGKEANSELTIHCPLWKTTTTRTLQTTWKFILTPHVQMKRCYTNTKTLIRLLNYFKLRGQHTSTALTFWVSQLGSQLWFINLEQLPFSVASMICKWNKGDSVEFLHEMQLNDKSKVLLIAHVCVWPKFTSLFFKAMK